MNQFVSLAQAAPDFGFKSGPALRKAFERNLIPQRFLVRIGTRILRVDVDALGAWLKEQRAYAPVGGTEAGNDQ